MLVGQDVSLQLPDPAAMTLVHYGGLLYFSNKLFYEMPWSWYFIVVTEYAWNMWSTEALVYIEATCGGWKENDPQEGYTIRKYGLGGVA